MVALSYCLSSTCRRKDKGIGDFNEYLLVDAFDLTKLSPYLAKAFFCCCFEKILQELTTENSQETLRALLKELDIIQKQTITSLF